MTPMIHLNMPDFVLGKSAYAYITELRQAHPEAFYDNVDIASVFGCFYGATWNGGGMLIGTNSSKTEVRDTIEFFNNELHIPLRFTFTNCLLEERDCYDRYCNMIAEVGNNGKNEILTSSPVLEEYLRKTYPNYKFCHSIIATKDHPYDTSGRYDLVVMKRRMNNNWEYLDSVPMQDRGKIEFLCTDPCPDDCPRLYSHYRSFARAQLECDHELPDVTCTMQHIRGAFTDLHTTTLETYISRETIEKEYLPRGYSQFKLSGRSNLGAIIFNIVNYMVKPEYRQDIVQQLYQLYL